MALPVLSLDVLTAGLWGVILVTIAYPIVGAVVDAIRERLWCREQRRSMAEFETRREALGRRARP